MTRPYTPPRQNRNGAVGITVKRCCNECGRELGDATPEETEAAIFGEPFPDVSDECGCPATIEQLAILASDRDRDVTDTSSWIERSPEERDRYTRDARAALRLLVSLGWAPAPNITTTVIEKAAIAAWASTGPSVANGFVPTDDWDNADESQKLRWRTRAAAALAAYRQLPTNR